MLLLSFLAGCSQWWQVRPYPDFVAAEIRAGDKVKAETVDGRKSEMIVEEVRQNAIIGQGQIIKLNEITSLKKYSKEAAANPCSPSIPLGCSVPKSVTLLISSQAEFEKFFYPSCEQHDYCYRHGAATYGEDQGSCDEQFLDDLEDQCSPDSLTSILLQTNMNFAECSATSIAYYHAVRKYGARKFSSSASTYCEYDGPP